MSEGVVQRFRDYKRLVEHNPGKQWTYEDLQERGGRGFTLPDLDESDILSDSEYIALWYLMKWMVQQVDNAIGTTP